MSSDSGIPPMRGGSGRTIVPPTGPDSKTEWERFYGALGRFVAACGQCEVETTSVLQWFLTTQLSGNDLLIKAIVAGEGAKATRGILTRVLRVAKASTVVTEAANEIFNHADAIYEVRNILAHNNLWDQKPATDGKFIVTTLLSTKEVPKSIVMSVTISQLEAMTADLRAIPGELGLAIAPVIAGMTGYQQWGGPTHAGARPWKYDPQTLDKRLTGFG